ncbi:amino-acid permease BAT1 homolog isoform X2 [Castanea sativa]|uniref:amino-acid permease BAT1 homolog isoform X2 n=1 Tax=Castanea sativa TaxID=21020 RepID=UPI003F65441A
MFLLTGAQEPDVKFINVDQATLSYQILIFHMWSKKVRHDFYWSLGSSVAFQAMVSIATIGLYIAYALPIFFRVTLARKSFIPGPFNLGRYGILVGWIAVLWVATISVLFSLPVSYPITNETLYYTPVAVGCLFILVITSWIFSARHWFRGPITNIDA